MSLKRKHTDEAAEGPSASSQAKRPRVAFDPEVEVRILEDWNDKGLELVRAEVRRALENHAAGDSGPYEQIKQLFEARPRDRDAPSSKLLTRYLVALTGRVSRLNKRAADLVHAVVDSQWLGRDDGFVETFTRFLGALVSAYGAYLPSVLTMLVANFKHLDAAASRPREARRISRAQCRARLHHICRYLLRLVPAASGTLASILAAAFPTDVDAPRTHATFVRNLLDLAADVPEVIGELRALVTERLVRMDVQVQVRWDELEEEDEEAVLADVVRSQAAEEAPSDDDADDSDDGSVSSAETEEPESQRMRELKEAVMRIDAVMDVLFEHYHPTFARGTWPEIEETFAHLLSQFGTSVLSTYRSRHTQFLLFHFAQVSPSLAERFAGICAHITFERSRGQIARLAAAAYLASFIARGAHVSPQLVRDVFGILGAHLDGLRAVQERVCVGPDLHRFGAYYAVAQALLYIFCFRWRDFLEHSDTFTAADADEILLDNGGMDLRWAPGVRDMLTRNIYSKLNPLKVCAPTIVTQFARIAHHLRFLYVFPLLETNKRMRVAHALRRGGDTNGTEALAERETALTPNRADSAGQLDAYFPFDPYRLPRSKRWMAGDYIEWKGVPGLDDERDDEGGEDAEDAEDAEDESDVNDVGDDSEEEL